MTKIVLSNNKRKSRPFILGGLGFAIILIVSSIMFLYPFASNQHKIYFNGAYPILYNGKQQANAKINNHIPYVPTWFIKKEVDPAIQYDENSNSIIITTSNKVIQMPVGSSTFFVNSHSLKGKNPPVITIGGQRYISLPVLLTIYPVQYKMLNGTNAIWIQKDGEKFSNGTITSKEQNKSMLRLRTSPSYQSPYTTETINNEKVMIEGEKSGFYLVRKENGIGGYIKKEEVHKRNNVSINVAKHHSNAIIAKAKEPVELTWEAVYTKNPDSSKIPVLTGINVVSPTWFSMNKDGSVKSLASEDYSKWAQSKGYFVWGLFSNHFDPDLTHLLLKDFYSRQKIILQLLAYCKTFHLQGINFDIEHVHQQDGPLVSQFIREASAYLHDAGLIASMDITFSAADSDWSSFYERKKLSNIVDYMIVMAYDEHWGSSSGVGSVASLPWVETNLRQLLKEVPNQKLILGVPLYTRLWKEQVNSDGTKEISSKALTMSGTRDWLKEKSLTPVYDPKTEQNYAQYFNPKENATYKIWIEDNVSLKKRTDLSIKYHLAGIASWARYFADPTAWAALNLNKVKSYVKN